MSELQTCPKCGATDDWLQKCSECGHEWRDAPKQAMTFTIAEWNAWDNHIKSVAPVYPVDPTRWIDDHQDGIVVFTERKRKEK